MKNLLCPIKLTYLKMVIFTNNLILVDQFNLFLDINLSVRRYFWNFHHHQNLLNHYLNLDYLFLESIFYQKVIWSPLKYIFKLCLNKFYHQLKISRYHLNLFPYISRIIQVRTDKYYLLNDISKFHLRIFENIFLLKFGWVLQFF